MVLYGKRGAKERHDTVARRLVHRSFKAVNDIRVGLQVTKLDVRGDVGDVELAGVYVFSDPGTRRTREDSVSFHSTVRRDARGWRIESLH